MVNGTTVDKMLNYGYWTLTPNLAIISGSYTITATVISAAVSVTSGCTYTLLRRASNILPWASLGVHNNNTQSAVGNTVTAVRSVLNSFGDFAIAYGELLSLMKQTKN